jgi:hypothetical protein
MFKIKLTHHIGNLHSTINKPMNIKSNSLDHMSIQMLNLLPNHLVQLPIESDCFESFEILEVVVFEGVTAY